MHRDVADHLGVPVLSSTPPLPTLDVSAATLSSRVRMRPSSTPQLATVRWDTVRANAIRAAAHADRGRVPRRYDRDAARALVAQAEAVLAELDDLEAAAALALLAGQLGKVLRNMAASVGDRHDQLVVTLCTRMAIAAEMLDAEGEGQAPGRG